MRTSIYTLPLEGTDDEIERKIRKLESQKFSRLDRVALWVNNQIGTFKFFLILVVWTVLWLLWNIFGPAEYVFDPFPGFVLWLFISNMIQLLFLPLIMTAQDLEGRRSELRAEIDFEINRRAEAEVREILARLEDQQKEIHQLLKQRS